MGWLRWRSLGDFRHSSEELVQNALERAGCQGQCRCTWACFRAGNGPTDLLGHPPALSMASQSLPLLDKIQTHQSYQLPWNPCFELTSLIESSKGDQVPCPAFQRMNFLGNAEPSRVLWWALGRQGGKDRTQLSLSLPHSAPGDLGRRGAIILCCKKKKQNRRQQQIISGGGAQDICKWVSSIKRVNQSAEKGWAGGYCCCSELSSYKQTPVWRVRMGLSLPRTTCFGVGGLEGDHVCLWQLPKSRLLAFGKPKSHILSLCFTWHASLPGSFLKNHKLTMNFFFTLLLMIKSAWYSSLAGCHTVQTKMSSDFLTHCTLAAFILFFSLPSAIYFFPLFFLRKKVFDKGFNTPATLRGPSPQRSPAQTLQCHRKPSRAVWTIRVLVTGPHIVLWYPWGKKKSVFTHHIVRHSLPQPGWRLEYDKQKL